MSSSVFLLPENGHLDGIRIRVCLRQKKFRQKYLARRLKISDGHLCRLLDGKHPASKEIIAGMAAILDVSPATIVVKDGPDAS